ncbi:hypothetical protein J6U76_01150 [bacterium]|nr:hypothetical protein [bacterium]
MSKRNILKIIAFVVGLYFFLEYILPEKVGGDFDSYEVNSPVCVEKQGKKLQFYVGSYYKGRGAIGRMVKTDGAWKKDPLPVLQRSLFMKFDQYGLAEPDCAATPEGLTLLYMGQNEKEPVLCFAESKDDGKTFQKRGPAVFSTNGLFKVSENDPNGFLPDRIKTFAAEYANGRWEVFLFTMTYRIFHAAGPDLKHLALDAEPLAGTTLTEKSPNAFDVALEGGAPTLFYIMDREIMKFRKDGSGQWTPLVWKAPHGSGSNDTMYAGGRCDSSDGTLYLGTKQNQKGRPIDSPFETTLCAVKLRDLSDGSPLATEMTFYKKVGAQPKPTYLSYGTEWAGKFLTVVGSFAIFIAMINLMLFHGKKIYQSALNYNAPQGEEKLPGGGAPMRNFLKNAGYSAVFLIFLAVMIVCALKGQTDEARGTGWKTTFDFLFNAIQAPMGSAVFSMITFYMISAAYRSFKVRSLEAGFLMAAAIVCMVGQMPIGELLASLVPESWKLLQLPWLSGKLLSVLNAAAYRAVLIGTLIGSVAISLRIWLGLDNSVYSSVD